MGLGKGAATGWAFLAVLAMAQAQPAVVAPNGTDEQHHSSRSPRPGAGSSHLLSAEQESDDLAAQELAGAHPVDFYILHAMARNPGIQAARLQVEAMSHRVTQAASLQDPMVDVTGFPFFPAVPQTAAGRGQVNVMASQTIPWLGKLAARAHLAQAETDIAWAELVEAELDVVEAVKLAYYEVSYVEQAIDITEEVGQLLRDLILIAEAKFRTGAVSQQDVLRAQLERTDLVAQLIGLRQELRSAQARLARLLAAPPDTELGTVAEGSAENVPADVDRLRELAVRARPELDAQLGTVARDQHRVRLARLDYLPDLVLKAEWGAMTRSRALAGTADGIDDVGIGLALNVPLYRGRLQAGVREAQAQVASSLRRYDAKRDQTLEEVTDLLAQVHSHQDLVRLFRDDILPKAEQTFEVSRKAYEAGQTDFLQLIDNWRQLLRYQIARRRMEASLRQRLASLERAVGGQLVEAPRTP